MLLRSIFVVLLLLEFFHDLESLVQFFESLDKCKWLRRIKLDKKWGDVCVEEGRW